MVAGSRGRNTFTLDGPNGTPEQSGNGNGAIGGTDTGGVSGDNGPIDPATLAGQGTGEGAGEPAKRGRGRPKGSGTKAKTGQASQLDVTSIEVLLFNIHALLAAATGLDKIAINQDEAGSLAKAVQNVQQFYPMHVSAKALAWSNLAMVAGTVYGSRAVAIWADMKTKENQQPQPANVTALRPNG